MRQHNLALSVWVLMQMHEPPLGTFCIALDLFRIMILVSDQKKHPLPCFVVFFSFFFQVFPFCFLI